MNISMKGGRVVIDGREFKGNSIQINGNNQVVVDGVVQDGTLTGPISVTVHGDVQSLTGNLSDVRVSGSAGEVRTVSGDVQCGDVTGNVNTVSGDVKAKNISGSVKTVSGDIDKF
jgi:DUF4097 and DUF4098 domain-containing protein YvlB